MRCTFKHLKLDEVIQSSALFYYVTKVNEVVTIVPVILATHYQNSWNRRIQVSNQRVSVIQVYFSLRSDTICSATEEYIEDR